MDIYQDIERATHIPFVDDNAVFYRKKQRRPPPPRIPRNAHLVEDYREDYYEEEKRLPEGPQTVNPLEIQAAIRMATGAVSCTQVEVDEYFRAKQTDSSGEDSKTNSANTSCCNMGCTDSSQSKTSDDLDGSSEVRRQDKVLRSCKLHRNAAIKGLLKNRQITVKDLKAPRRKTRFNLEDQAGTSENIDRANNSLEIPQGYQQFIPFPSDPDILITQWQAFGVDESKHKHIDFTVPRLGKKSMITPVEYHINEIDDESFNFVKKEPKSK